MRVEFEFHGAWAPGEFVTWLVIEDRPIAIVLGDNGLFYQCELHQVKAAPLPA